MRRRTAGKLRWGLKSSVRGWLLPHGAAGSGQLRAAPAGASCEPRWNNRFTVGYLVVRKALEKLPDCSETRILTQVGYLYHCAYSWWAAAEMLRVGGLGG